MVRWFFLIVFITIICSCGVFQNEDDYTFAWDMTLENHTGIPKNLYKKDGKHRGMSVFHWRDSMDLALNQLIKNNVEWIAIIPFYFQENDKTREMRMPEVAGQWDHRDSMYMNVIENIHDRGLHVMLKPHLWMHDGWRSNIQFETEEDWDIWFESYRKNLIHHALLAELLDIELLCIGAEFRSSILKQPDKWEELIEDVKSIYSGKLTYAANWDAEYAEVSFWDQMDFIGIQAYFPLTTGEYPSLSEIKKGWKRHIATLKALSERYNKPILFSEVGYRSDNIATIEPWVWGSALDKDTSVVASNITQNLAYEALFQELWDKEWFAGMYFWQWHNTSRRQVKYENRDFTPRFKPAENTLAKWYGKER